MEIRNAADAICAHIGSGAREVVRYGDDPRIEIVARAIATEGFGRQWNDFQRINAFDTDQSDLEDYAVAAINAILKLIGQSGEEIMTRTPGTIELCPRALTTTTTRVDGGVCPWNLNGSRDPEPCAVRKCPLKKPPAEA